MLCRALLAAVVLSYVLCVLLLSGVQKEDIDASTLRKLQRHNVNIDDINDQQLRKQCLGKTNIPVTMLTQENTVTEKSVTAKEIGIEKDRVESQAEDSAKLRKIFEYLEYNRKGEKREELKSKDNTSTLRPAPNSKLKSSYSFRSTNQNINVEDTSIERSGLRGKSVANKKDENLNKANINKKLNNLMNIWQTDIDTITNTTLQESTTVKATNEGTLSKSTKDVEYITKIVEEILSKKKTNDPITDVDKVFDAKSKNNTIAPTTYLNNCKLGSFYANNHDDKETYETFDKRLSSDVKVPVTNANNDDYIICKKVEAKEKEMLADRIHNNMIYNILRSLNQKRLQSSDNESAIRNSLEYKPKSVDINRQNNRIKTGNIHKKRLNLIDKEIITALKNQSEGIIPNRHGDRMKTWDTLKEGLDHMDAETARALETALQKQSNNYNQIFSRQRDLVEMDTIDKERINLQDNKRGQELQSALIAQPPTFSYKPSKQDDDLENKDYNMFRYAYFNTLNNQKQTMEPRENIVINNVPYINNEKSVDTINTKAYDPNLDNRYKRPWFYSEVGNVHLRTKNKEKLKGVLFRPNDDSKFINKESKPNKNWKKWSPYFDTLAKKPTIVETDEIERPKSQKPILVDSYRLSQLNNREMPQELTDNSKKQFNFDGFNQKKNESPNIIKEGSGEQFETKKYKKISQSHCQTIHETRIECMPAVEYESERSYFRNKQIEKQNTDIKEHSEKSEYFNYQFPSRPRTTQNRYVNDIADEEIINRNGTEDSIKLPAFPQNVIKDIANSIKELVLKDLITTKIPTTTTLSTTTPTPRTTTMTTATPKITISISTMTTIPTKPMERTSRAAEIEQPLKIQDASNALQKIMEMFEKISSFKDKIVKHENNTYRENVGYDTKIEATTHTILNRPELLAQQKTENRLAYPPQSLQVTLDNQIPNVPLPLQPNTENREPYQQQSLQYIPQAVQIKPENDTPYILPALQLRGVNRLPYVPQPLQSNPESRTPYFPPAIQMTSDNRLPYDPQNLHNNPENGRPYFPPVFQLKAENRIPYVQQDVQMKTENRTPYGPQAVQLKAGKEDRLPYDPHTSQRKLETRTPYFPAANRMPYFPQAVQIKTENNLPRDPQTVQSIPENLTPYFPQSLQRKPENRVPYDPHPLQGNPDKSVSLQRKPENRIPYDPLPLQGNPDNSVSYLPQPLQYAPNGVQQKTESRIPYDSPPLQRNTENIYGIKKAYYNSKLELDPYQDKEVLEPIKQKPQPRKYAITVQTNSGEIAPLKIEVQKPLLQTIVLTTKSPAKVEQHSDEIFNVRKPKSISKRHQVDKRKKDSEINDNGEKNGNQYFSRHTHRDSETNRLKSRKIKKEREVNQQHKPREFQEIERFHEKLETEDAWSPYEEENIAKRMQRPIIKNNNYDDTHFRNFLQTQQKVNAMLERILATSKNKPINTQVM